MKNLKNQLLIFLYLILMIVAIFFAVYIVVVDIFWLLKICVILATISFTIYLFMLMNKTNKKLVYIPKEETKSEQNVKEVKTNKLLCPKCFNPYDGETCFVCGYNKGENKA
jgi:hypothetical protein